MQDRNHRKSPSPFILSSPIPFLVGEDNVLTRDHATGFRQQAIQGTETILGTGDFAQVCSVGCPKGWNPKAHWVAYAPAYIFDTAAKRGHRVQSHAGIVAALLTALDLGHLYAGNHAGQACGSSGCTCTGVFFRDKRSVPLRGTKRVKLRSLGRRTESVSATTKKEVQKGHQNVPFCNPVGFVEISATLLE